MWKKIALPLSLGLLFGCGSDPKAPTKENFAKAAQAYLDTQPMCVAVTDANSELRVNRVFSGGSMDDQSPPTMEDAVRQSPLLKTLGGQARCRDHRTTKAARRRAKSQSCIHPNE